MAMKTFDRICESSFPTLLPGIFVIKIRALHCTAPPFFISLTWATSQFATIICISVHIFSWTVRKYSWYTTQIQGFLWTFCFYELWFSHGILTLNVILKRRRIREKNLYCKVFFRVLLRYPKNGKDIFVAISLEAGVIQTKRKIVFTFFEIILRSQ